MKITQGVAGAANDELSCPRSVDAEIQTGPRNAESSRFDIYRAESVGFISVLFGGGDWHWRLTSPAGLTLVC